MSMERAIRFGAFAVAGALVFSACQDDTRPVVVTDEQNVIVSLPAHARWDVEMDGFLHGTEDLRAVCDQWGGKFVNGGQTGAMCVGVDH